MRKANTPGFARSRSCWSSSRDAGGEGEKKEKRWATSSADLSSRRACFRERKDLRRRQGESRPTVPLMEIDVPVLHAFAFAQPGRGDYTMEFSTTPSAQADRRRGLISQVDRQTRDDRSRK